MQAYEQYNLILSIIVFLAFTIVFSVLISIIIKLSVKAINAGIEDEQIKTEYLQQQAKKKNNFFTVVFNGVIPVLVCVILACTLAFSLYSRFSQNSKVGDIPTFKVVETGSMEVKNKDNGYLFDNNLNDQIATFDLVLLRKLPKEEDLKLYDIVVYEVNGFYIIHRIVAIEEPNAAHPNERWFVLRGDANIYADDYPVTYDQMSSIYRGESIPHLGMLVIFMQSPAGMLCFLLVLLAVIVTPIIEKAIEKAIQNRLVAMGLVQGEIEVAATQPSSEETEAPSIDSKDASLVEESVEEKHKSTLLEEDIHSKHESSLVEEGIHSKHKSSLVEEGIHSKHAPTLIEENREFNLDRFNMFGERKLFIKRLSLLNEQKSGWYKQLNETLMQVPSVRKTNAKYHEIYMKGRAGIAKIMIKGKSLYVYLAVDPSKYTATKYGIKDVSTVKSYANYPAECKVTSNRKLKYLLEIIKEF